MKKNLFLIFLIFTLIILPSKIFASTGFIPGQIWYSAEDLTEGETVNIYTIVWNGEDDVLKAKVEFYDKSVVLGTREVSVSAKSTKEVSISWKVTSGSHTISARITSSTKGEEKDEISIKNNETEKDKFSVPVSIVTSDGKEATSSDIIESQIDKISSEVSNAIPDSVSSTVSDKLEGVNEFLDNSSTKLSEEKYELKSEIEQLENNDSSFNEDTSAIKKPLSYIKLFFVSLFLFIFSHKFIFYLVSLILLFLIIKFIYKKIKK